MNKTLLLSLALALALLSSGCIANMDNLKDKLGGGAADESVTPAATSDETTTPNSPPVVNETPKKPPVARLTVFAAGGALLFKSTFTAEDPGETVMVSAKGKLDLISGDSEVIERGATLTGFAWTVNGKAIEGAQKASFEIPEPGLYTITLKVTDSNAKSDTQTVKVALAPEPYEETVELVAGQVVGQEGDAPADVAWDLAAPEKPATVTKVVITAAPPITCDAVLEVLDAEGNVLGSADNVGHQDLTQTEELELGALAFGAYTIRIAPYTCIATEVPITVTVTYLPVVEGLDASHGEHAGH